MKATAIFVLFMFAAFLSVAQDLTKTKMLREVDVKPPAFTGIKGTVDILIANDFGSIYDYLAEKVQYPERSENSGKEGTTIVQFTVFPSGELDDFRIVNSVTSDIDDEVIRVLKSTDGMWRPGQNNGTPVAMEKEVAVTFQIEGSDHLKLARNLYSRANKKLLKNKYKKALRLLDYALVYQPYDKTILLKRGQTQLLAGNMGGACQDWNRLKSLGSDLADVYLEKHCEMEDYAVNK
jgi:TonB family protein